jgi:hypothetical protein
MSYELKEALGVRPFWFWFWFCAHRPQAMPTPMPMRHAPCAGPPREWARTPGIWYTGRAMVNLVNPGGCGKKPKPGGDW